MLPLISMLSPFLDVPYLILLTLILYLFKRSSVNLLATILWALTYFGLCKVLISTSIFMLLGHPKRGIKAITIYSFLAFIYLEYYNFLANLNWSLNYIVFLAVIGGLTASLIESIDIKDKNMVILLALATVYTIFHIYAIDVQIEQLAIAFLISFLLSLFATKAGVADESGLISATLIGTLTIVFSDLRFFLILLLFYALGSAVTKYKYSLKLKRGIAEQAGGARGYANVFSNSLMALFFVMNYGMFKHDFFVIAFVSSVATALGDTMASEIGKTADKVYLITNFKRVKPGTSGGISLIGEVAAMLGCLIVCFSALILGLLDVKGAIIAFISAFIAIHVDSLLGATLEKWGYLTNAGVNFFATLSAGLFCLSIISLLNL